MYKFNSENTYPGTLSKIGRGLRMVSSTIEYHDEAPNITIGFSVKLNKCHITIKKGGCLVIGDVCEMQGRIIVEENCSVKIGMGLVCNDGIFIHANESGTISIGNDCLFSNPKIYNSDQHAIYDIETGDRLNKPKNVDIGDRVWIAKESIVLKGSEIGNGCVIGAGSVVSGKKSQDTIVAGNPAKEIRSGICWSRIIMDQASSVIPYDFPVSKFRSMAMQFRHDEVISMGIGFWENRKKINKSDYFIIYYLCRSILDKHFRSRAISHDVIMGLKITVRELIEVMMQCFEISERRNGPSGCYAYLAAQILNDKNEAERIYRIVKPLFSYIDNDEYKVKS